MSRIDPRIAVGVACATVSALFGVGWQLITRHGVTGSLGPLEISALRYCIPGVLMLPVWWRVGFKPATLSLGHLAVMLFGGLPFGMLVFVGAQFAPAAHIAVFLAGTIPLFTAIATRVMYREPVAPVRAAGFLIILVGAALLGFSEEAPEGSWRGDLLFMLAAVAWAIHTVAFRASGLSPWQGAAVVNGWSAVLMVGVVAVFGAPRLLTAPLHDVVLQAVWQGTLAGLLGLAAFMAAVVRLGSARAALSVAAVPPMVALGGTALLGEPLGAATLGAVVLVGVGIVLASGALAPSPSGRGLG